MRHQQQLLLHSVCHCLLKRRMWYIFSILNIFSEPTPLSTGSTTTPTIQPDWQQTGLRKIIIFIWPCTASSCSYIHTVWEISKFTNWRERRRFVKCGCTVDCWGIVLYLQVGFGGRVWAKSRSIRGESRQLLSKQKDVCMWTEIDWNENVPHMFKFGVCAP